MNASNILHRSLDPVDTNKIKRRWIVLFTKLRIREMGDFAFHWGMILWINICFHSLVDLNPEYFQLIGGFRWAHVKRIRVCNWCGVCTNKCIAVHRAISVMSGPLVGRFYGNPLRINFMHPFPFIWTAIVDFFSVENAMANKIYGIKARHFSHPEWMEWTESYI